MELIAPLIHQDTTTRLLAERGLNNRLEGGCQVPIASYSELEGDQIYLRGLVGSVDGSTILRSEARGAQTDAEAIGIKVAEELLAQGADKILQELYAEQE